MKFSRLFLTILLLILIITPRLAGLKSFVTLDEPFWLTTGGNFYHDLSHGKLENVIYEYHPAVTTMWIVTGAFVLYYPQFRSLDISVDNRTFDGILNDHGQSPLTLLYFSRLLQLFVIVVAAMAIFYLISTMIGEQRAFLFTAFISSAPFFLGHSRILNHEGMVALFTLVSFFGLMVHLEHGRKIVPLFISAVAASLAQLTKSSAMAMMPAIALVMIVSVIEKTKEGGFSRSLMDHLKIFGIWLAGLAITYVIIWPGMWVAPGKMLYEVYGNAFSNALQGARLDVTQELDPSQFNLASIMNGIKIFGGELATRTTPLTWMGWILAIIFFTRRGEKLKIYKKIIAYLLVNAVMFVVFFSVAQGRNSLHYIMSSHVSVDGIAVLGWMMAVNWLSERWAFLANFKFQMGIAISLILVQMGSALTFYPYYYTYTNPFFNNSIPSDYGEGFELAAEYLSQKPDVESLKVFSFRGRGPFSYFFPGETIILNPIFIEEPGMVSILERLKLSDYLVFNDAMPLRTTKTAQFADALKNIEPEKSIHIRGVYTIRIYRVADLPPSFYEAIQK